MHTEGKASSFAQQGSPHLPAPISLASGFWDANASTREKAAWLALGLEPTPGSSLPGLIPVSAQVDGASPSATRPRPLDSVLVFGCRQVCIPLHSSGEACSCLSPKLAKLVTVTQDLQFLRASRGAQADKAGAGCYAGPYGGIPFPASQCRTPGWLARLSPHFHHDIPSISLTPNPAGLCPQRLPGFLNLLGLGPLPRWQLESQL